MFTLLVFFPHLSFSEKQEIKPVTHEESSTETLCLQINVSLGLEGIQGAIDFTGDNLGSKQDKILSSVPFKYTKPNINHERARVFKRLPISHDWEERGKKKVFSDSF